VSIDGRLRRVSILPRWDSVLRGRLTTIPDANGVKEPGNASDRFYWPPGHNVKVDSDAEIFMFSPKHEHSHVIRPMAEIMNN